MELIHANMRKSASLHGGICFIKVIAREAKFISNFQNLGNKFSLWERYLNFYLFFNPYLLRK